MTRDEFYKWLESHYPREKGYRYRNSCFDSLGWCPMVSQYHTAKDGTLTWLREFPVCPCREAAKDKTGPVWTSRR